MPINFERTQPSTIDGAVDLLLNNLGEEEMRDVLATRGPVGTWASRVHFLVGRRMRNGWGLWAGSNCLVQDAVARFGISHADDISGLILHMLESRARGLPFDAEALAASYRAHWSNEGRLREEVLVGERPTLLQRLVQGFADVFKTPTE